MFAYLRSTPSYLTPEDEVFGPVMAVLKYDPLEGGSEKAGLRAVVARANASSFGLAASILTRNVGAAIVLAVRVSRPKV